MPSVLALGLDPTFVNLPDRPDLSPELIRAFIEAQLERVRSLGYMVQSCLVDSGETAEAVTSPTTNIRARRKMAPIRRPAKLRQE